jgi:arylsulfotransferase ASST
MRRLTARRRHHRLALVATSAFLIAGLFGPAVGAEASPPAGKVGFSSAPSLFPKFGPNIYDYVVRCDDAPVTVQGHATGGWEAKIGNYPYRSGDMVAVVPLSAGRGFSIAVREVGRQRVYRYHVRCLPNDFPNYTFTRYGPVSPRFFSVSRNYVPEDQQYAMIFDDHGVPIWWYHTRNWDPRVLPGGNILWWNGQRWEIHRLDGSLVRSLDAVGHPANAHDLQLLGNGDHLTGSYVRRSHVDTSAYGGSSDATVSNTELQQVSPGGQLVWRWRSQDHIALAETGRHWPFAVDHGYDIEHWNSIEPAGDSVIASFRHLDAVYKIQKSTGDIVWKLGGTSTPESLEVINDPRGYTLGAQHDARLLPDGTLTVFDNRTNLAEKTPRAVRYRIDQTAGTATLLESITDPAVPRSSCCGSARRLGNGDWLIDWAKTGPTAREPGPIGGYRPDGQRTFLLTFDSHFSYRAEPVLAGAVSAQDLRDGMRAMAQAQLR